MIYDDIIEAGTLLVANGGKLSGTAKMNPGSWRFLKVELELMSNFDIPKGENTLPEGVVCRLNTEVGQLDISLDDRCPPDEIHIGGGHR